MYRSFNEDKKAIKKVAIKVTAKFYHYIRFTLKVEYNKNTEIVKSEIFNKTIA